MIALFARSNHPHGYGYSTPEGARPPYNAGIGAHGYVVVGVICETMRQVEKVRQHITQHGLDLPDKGRIIYPDPDRAPSERPYEDRIGGGRAIRWYSGGAHDWDYLFTTGGNFARWGHEGQAHQGSRGDNRFCMVYTAKEVLDA